MKMEKLIDDRNNLVLQRSGLKDQIEGIEKALGAIVFAIQVLEANQPKESPSPE